MGTEWPDIPGVTAVGGRPRLPAEPEVAVRTLAGALDAAAGSGLVMADLVERVQRATRADRARVEGLAGWLPLSRVARWDTRTGHLHLHPGTDLIDLAYRYAAWVATQPVPREHAEASRKYALRVGELAAELVQSGRAPAPVSTAITSTRATSPEAPIRPASPSGPSAATAELTRKISGVLAALDASFLERRAHTRAALLSLLSGQHVLLLGPPGTAKSLLARALCGAFEGSAYFEYLLSRFTHPDELFGPVSIPGLKAEDYRRLTTGFLPHAGVAFLDEIFKANSAILNSLLTLVNERVFHHGRHRDTVPLIGLVGASNELPDPEGGLAALFDRFLVRMTVPPIAGADAFLQVATGRVPETAIAAEFKLTPADLATLREAADRVEVPPAVQDALLALWRTASRLEWQVSDRRWRAAVGMLKVAAASAGRSSLDPLDLLLLEVVLPPTPERTPEVREAILEGLGAHTVPEHDLRAQWMLLRSDRVAPIDGTPLGAPPGHDRPWTERLGFRREQVARFLAHHRAAIERLGADREALEDLAETHLWIDQLPAQVLATHIEASRDLAQILTRAEAYQRALATPSSVASSLLASLPETSRRVYGTGAVCHVHLLGQGTTVGLTLAGEREPLRQEEEPHDVPVRHDDVPLLQLDPQRLLDWVDGRLEVRELLTGVPSYASRNVGTAFQSVRRLLGSSAVPAPPDLPAP